MNIFLPFTPAIVQQLRDTDFGLAQETILKLCDRNLRIEKASEDSDYFITIDSNDEIDGWYLPPFVKNFEVK